MSAVLDALVVGAGAVGSGYDNGRQGELPLSHAGAYASHSGVRLAGGVDPDPMARRRFTERWDVPCHADLDSALTATTPGLVSVCTPVEQRSAIVDRLLDAGVGAIWCEKPLAATVEEARLLIAACERAGAALQVNFLRRFDPLHRQVAARVAELGGPLHVDVRYSGSLHGYGTHGVDLFRWLAGEVAWIHAVEVEGREPLVVLGGAAGATATLAQVPDADAELFEVDVLTAHERLTLSGLGEELLTATPEPSGLFADVVRLAYGPGVGRDGLGPAMMQGVQALLDHLADGTPLPCSGADGLAALAVHDAVEASLAGACRVPVGVPA